MALFLACLALMAGVAAVAFALITKPARHGIRRLESYANHPANRGDRREEKP
jgi:peptidoglycan/LPS O-acetylase OafA/YrhL